MDVPMRKKRIAQPPRKRRAPESQQGHNQGHEKRRNNVYEDERRIERRRSDTQNEDQGGRWSIHGSVRHTDSRQIEGQNGHQLLEQGSSTYMYNPPYGSQSGHQQAVSNSQHQFQQMSSVQNIKLQDDGNPLGAVEEENPSFFLNMSYSSQPIPSLQLAHLSRLNDYGLKQYTRSQSPEKMVAQSIPMSPFLKRQRTSSPEAPDVLPDSQAMKLIRGLKERQVAQCTETVTLSTKQSKELESSSENDLKPPQTLKSLGLHATKESTKPINEPGVEVHNDPPQTQQPTIMAAIPNSRMGGTRGRAVRIKNIVSSKLRGRKPRPSFSAKVLSRSSLSSEEQSNTENRQPQSLEPRRVPDHRSKYSQGSNSELSYGTNLEREGNRDAGSASYGSVTRKRDTIKQLLDSSPSILGLLRQLSVPEFKRLQQQIEVKARVEGSNTNSKEEQGQPSVKMRGGGGHKRPRSYSSDTLYAERTSSLHVFAPIGFMYESALGDSSPSTLKLLSQASLGQLPSGHKLYQKENSSCDFNSTESLLIVNPKLAMLKDASKTPFKQCTLDLFSSSSLFISPTVSSQFLYWDIGSNEEWKTAAEDLDSDVDDLRGVKERAKVTDCEMSEADEDNNSNIGKASDHEADNRIYFDPDSTSQISQDPNFRSFALGLRPRTRLRGGYAPSSADSDDSTSGSPISDYAFSPSGRGGCTTKTPLFIDFLEEQYPMNVEFPVELKLPSNLTKEIADNFRIKATIRAVQYNDYGECLGYGATVQLPVVLENLETGELGLSLHFSARLEWSPKVIMSVEPPPQENTDDRMSISLSRAVSLFEASPALSIRSQTGSQESNGDDVRYIGALTPQAVSIQFPSRGSPLQAYSNPCDDPEYGMCPKTPEPSYLSPEPTSEDGNIHPDVAIPHSTSPVPRIEITSP